MPEASKYTINADTVQITEQNLGTIIGTQRNYAEPNTQPADQLTNILAQLRTKYPNKADAEIFEILLNGFDTMPQKNPQNWQRWQDIFSVLFSGGVEATKILVPVAGIPIEILKRLYEIYDRNQKSLPGA